MSKTPINPYLFFGGNCEEAVNFYKEAVHAEVEMIMYFKESPDPIPEAHRYPGIEDKVMHASIRIGGSLVMLSDGCDQETAFKGFSLSLSVQSESDAHEAFNALSDGGKVEMPLAKTFWSPCFGMLTDRFGVSWMVSVYDPEEGSA